MALAYGAEAAHVPHAWCYFGPSICSMLRTRIVPLGPTLNNLRPKARTLNGAFFIFFTIWYYNFFFFFFLNYCMVISIQYESLPSTICEFSCVYIYIWEIFLFFIFYFLIFNYRAFYVYFIFWDMEPFVSLLKF